MSAQLHKALGRQLHRQAVFKARCDKLNKLLRLLHWVVAIGSFFIEHEGDVFDYFGC
jgi:hypothetical protein